MSKPYDVNPKELFHLRHDDWANWLRHRLRLQPGPVRVDDTDLSAITMNADKVLIFGGKQPRVVLLEWETSWAGGMETELAQAAILLHNHHQLPVTTVLMLLRPKANSPELTGTYLSHTDPDSPDETNWLKFKYHVIRLWEESIDTLLNAGPGLAPLAALTNEAARDLPASVARIETYLHQHEDVDAKLEQELIYALFVMLGLRYTKEMVDQIARGSAAMETNTFVQLMQERAEAKVREKSMRESEIATLQRLLLKYGRSRLGPPTTEAETAVRAIIDPARLERMLDNLSPVTTWDELLTTA